MQDFSTIFLYYKHLNETSVSALIKQEHLHLVLSLRRPTAGYTFSDTSLNT